MAKGKNPDTNGANAGKMIPADCVSVLLMAMGNTSISNSQYEMMSALDGTRTAAGFQHQFRSITAKAKELKARMDNGEVFTPVQPSKKRSADATPPMTPTPKKPKATPKSSSKKEKAKPKAESPTQDLGDDAAQDDLLEGTGLGDFIKQEKAWDEQQFN